MLILFPCDPLAPRRVESDFAEQWDAAQSAGFATALLDFDALTRENNLTRALRFAPEMASEVSALYRGWMLKPPDYQRLHAGLTERGYQFSAPEQYQLCHEIPGWLLYFQGLTPETRWLPQTAIAEASITVLLQEFGAGPLIVKDFVKSRKHDWHEACFIPQATDTEHALRVIHRFLELQGEDLNGGLVLRRFVPLKIIGEHPRSKIPLGREWRIFVVGGTTFPIPYWGQDDNDVPDLAPFKDAMAQIASPFWTMDVARTQTGAWIVLELGDGQVSGLPEGTDVAAFYRWLKETTNES